MAKTRVRMSDSDVYTRNLQAILTMSTAEIGLPVRTTNCLEAKDIYTVEDLLNATPEKLLSISNFGEKTLEEVFKALERYGFHRDSLEQDVNPRIPR